MCRVLITFITLLLTFNLQAQSISGYVKDNKGRPINGATLSLLRTLDSSIIKLQISNEVGFFSYSSIDTGKYIVAASFVGYQTAYLPASFPGEPIAFVLQETASEMKRVIISSKKPLIQVKGDMTVLNVEGTINATGNTVLDLLRKSPSVTVNSNERISMNGKSGVQVFIDGKPTPLTGDDLATYLKGMQSSEVEAIELITHPSAKYEAAGNAGIINIRLKKNKSLGTNATVTTGYNHGVYGKYNSGLSFNHRTAKVNVFGNVSYNGGITQKKMTVNRALQDSSFAQYGTLKDNSNTINLKTGIDYFIHPKQTVGILINGSFGNTELTNNSFTAIAPASSSPSRLLQADNVFNTNRDHLDFNVNYLYSSKKGRSLNVNADYGFYKIDGLQLQPNIYFDGSGQNKLNTITYEMLVPSSIDIYSLKTDYEQAVGKGKVAVGVKTAYVTTDNDFQRYTLEANSRALDYVRSNRFQYQEQIHAAYLSYNRQWQHIQLQAGLRAENTIMNGTSTGKKQGTGGLQDYDSVIHQNYLNLFPSVAIHYSRTPDHQFGLSLSRRIDRPAYQDLNPFELKVDDYLIQKGNAYLRPQYTNSVGMTYVFKQKVNTAINYSIVKDVAAWILDTTETSKSIVSKQNLASQKLWAMNISYPLQHKSYSMYANINLAHTAYLGDFGFGRHIDQKAFGMNIYLQNSLKFAKTWTAELTGFYYSPSVHEGTMRVQSLWAIDAGVQTKLKEDRVTLKLAVSDVFNTLQFKSHSFFAGQLVNYNTKNETRLVKLSMSFRLGNNDVKGARQRRSGAEEELKRVN
jgi:hypothetical protein